MTGKLIREIIDRLCTAGTDLLMSGGGGGLVDSDNSKDRSLKCKARSPRNWIAKRKKHLRSSALEFGAPLVSHSPSHKRSRMKFSRQHILCAVSFCHLSSPFLNASDESENCANLMSATRDLWLIYRCNWIIQSAGSWD